MQTYIFPLTSNIILNNCIGNFCGEIFFKEIRLKGNEEIKKLNRLKCVTSFYTLKILQNLKINICQEDLLNVLYTSSPQIVSIYLFVKDLSIIKKDRYLKRNQVSSVKKTYIKLRYIFRKSKYRQIYIQMVDRQIVR